MKHCNKNQTDQDQVWDNSCHVTYTLKFTLLQLPLFLNTSFDKSKNCAESFKEGLVKNLPN